MCKYEKNRSVTSHNFLHINESMNPPLLQVAASIFVSEVRGINSLPYALHCDTTQVITHLYEVLPHNFTEETVQITVVCLTKSLSIARYHTRRNYYTKFLMSMKL